MTFKVGDRVRIVNLDRSGIADEDQSGWIGETGTIKKIFDDELPYYVHMDGKYTTVYQDGHWYLNDDHLELADVEIKVN